MAAGARTGWRWPVICSQNELAAVLKKAAVGVGFPTGVADDLAAAGVALASRGQPGAAVVLANVRAGFRDSAPVEVTESRVVFESCCLAAVGSSAFDLLAAWPGRQVEYTEVDGVELLVGFAAAAAARSGATYRLVSADGASIDVSPEGADLHLLPAVSGPVVVSVANPNAGATGPQSTDPVEVVDEVWAELSILAARTYVPATEASRLNGAGAGLTDND